MPAGEPKGQEPCQFHMETQMNVMFPIGKFRMLEKYTQPYVLIYGIILLKGSTETIAIGRSNHGLRNVCKEHNLASRNRRPEFSVCERLAAPNKRVLHFPRQRAVAARGPAVLVSPSRGLCGQLL